ncbi:PEP-CTERM sorting domain-containing protein [Candidatus Poribacteria bacterium]|nr:PEP-CTERM sorting domain-containing protein [Candidatus Poribacteria bacterium]
MKKISMLFLVQIFIAVFAVSAFASPLTYGGHVYDFVPGLYWPDAEANAVAWGGHLVTINDSAEQAWLTANFGGMPWIGINDIKTEGSFEWVSGEPVTYTNWYPGEPNDYLWGEDWGHMNWEYTGKWNDLGEWSSGLAGGFGVAEKVAPEPASWILFATGIASLAFWKKKKQN